MNLQEEYQKLGEVITECDHRGDYVGLAKHMERYLELTGEIHGFDSAEYATTLNDYGGIHRDIGNNRIAEEAFLKSAGLIAKLAGENDPDYGSVLNNLAGLYRLMKDYNNAEIYFAKALDIYKNALGEEHFLYISGLNNLGLVYQDQGRFEEAEKLHRHSLDLLEKANDNPIAIATTMNNLASALRQMGQLDEVEGLLKGALQIYGEKLGENHSLYAYGLNNLAAYYMTSGNYELAGIFYKRSLDICTVLFGKDSRNYDISRRNYEYAVQKAKEAGMQA